MKRFSQIILVAYLIAATQICAVFGEMLAEPSQSQQQKMARHRHSLLRKFAKLDLETQEYTEKKTRNQNRVRNARGKERSFMTSYNDQQQLERLGQTTISSTPNVINSGGSVLTYLNLKDSITVAISVGSNQQQNFNLKLDTTQNDLIVSTCLNDFGNVVPTFYALISTTLDMFSPYLHEDSDFYGYMASDNICFIVGSKGSLCETTSFIATLNEESLYPYSGIVPLGMGAPLYGTHFLRNSDFAAYQWGYIHARYPDNTTTLTLGGVNEDYLANNAEFEMLDTVQMDEADSWTLELDYLKLSGRSGQDTLAEGSDSSPIQVTFNISTDDIWVPVSIFGTISTAFASVDDSLTCSSGVCYLSALCSDITNKFGDLIFKFVDGTRQYSIPNDYIHDYNLETKCALRLKQHTEGHIILGNAFFKHFYTLYDIEYKQIGIALADYSGGSVTEV